MFLKALFFCLLGFTTFASAENVLNLVGKAAGLRPDILFLRPKLVDDKTSSNALHLFLGEGLAQFMSEGTQLEGHYAKGRCEIRYILQKGGYRIVAPTQGDWVAAVQEAREVVALCQETRVADDLLFPPVCFYLELAATPDEIKASLQDLRPLSNTLVILIPETKSRLQPAYVYWQNVVRPDFVSEDIFTMSCWEPTLAEIAGLPVPASSTGVSLLPVLTGSGYPLRQPIHLLVSTLAKDMPFASTPRAKSRYHEARRFAVKPPYDWVPDLRTLFPEERLFLTNQLPNALQVTLPHAWYRPAKHVRAISLAGDFAFEDLTTLTFVAPVSQSGVVVSIHDWTLLVKAPNTVTPQRAEASFLKGTHPYRIDILLMPGETPDEQLSINQVPLFAPPPKSPSSFKEAFFL